MDTKQIEDIERRLLYASSVPWRESDSGKIVDNDNMTVCFMAMDSNDEIDEWDSDFIASTPTDIRSLLDEVKRLKYLLRSIIPEIPDAIRRVDIKNELERSS